MTIKLEISDEQEEAVQRVIGQNDFKGDVEAYVNARMQEVLSDYVRSSRAVDEKAISEKLAQADKATWDQVKFALGIQPE